MADGFSKRLACQIASQLPEGTEDALQVLNLAREIVICLGEGWGRPATVPTKLFAAERTGQASSQAGAREVPTDRLDKSSQA